MLDLTIIDYLDFSILIPTIVGIYRYRNIGFALKLLCCYLCFGVVFEFAAYLIPKTPFISNIQNYIFTVIETTFLTYMMQMWTQKNQPFLFFLFVLILICTSICIEVSILGINSFHFSLNITLGEIIIALTAINAVAHTISKKRISQMERKIRLLILIPLLINFLFSLIAGFMMHFFYNPLNPTFFIKLYSVVSITNAGSYIFYTLAFLWAPLKEKFLLHSY